MARVRVYEIARDLKMESKALVQRLKGMGIEVNSHQSTLSADQVLKIKKELGTGDAPAAKTSARKVIRRRRSAPESATPVADEKAEKKIENVEAKSELKVSAEKG